jgi:TRAP-type C4-dicarboxylate transport system permease small subunit
MKEKTSYLGIIISKSAEIGSAALFLLLLIVVLQVVSRYLFNAPINGTVELIEFFMIFVVFLGFGKCELNNDNIKVDILINHLPECFQKTLEIFNIFVFFAIIAMIIFQNILQIKISYASNIVSGVLHIPHYPFYVVIVAGYILLFIVLVKKFFCLLARTINTWNQ